MVGVVDDVVDGGLPAATARYEYRRFIGSGASASVYEAWDSQLQRAVAIKRIALPGAHNALREARMAADLRHPAFVAVHEVLEHDAQACIVMELVRGRLLSQVLDGVPVSEAQARDWMAQAAAALTEAHRQHVVHGDIKPANLMIDEDGRLRILDFGIARAFDAQRTLTGGEPAAGTLRYMAPELLLGAPPNAAADIYALGLVLYELLGGAQAFAMHSGLALAYYKLHVEAPLPPAPGASAHLHALIGSMTHREVALRPASMTAVRDVLRSESMPPADSQPAPPTLQRKASTIGLRKPLAKPLAWSAAMLLCVVVAAAGWQVLARPGGMASSAQWQFSQLDRVQRSLRNYDETGNLEQAVATLQEVLENQPRNATAAALLSIAYCMLNGGDAKDPSWVQRADVSSAMALRADDQLALAHVARAWFFENAGHFEQAEAAYGKALMLDPHEFYALLGLGRMLTRLSRAAEARAVLQAALARYPEEAVFHNALGTLLYEQADYRGAEQEFRRSVALKPNGPFGYANLSAALMRQDRLDEALEVLQQGLRAQPNSRLYGNLGTALFARGRYEEAAAAFERALSSSQGNPNEYLQWANLADALRWVPGRQTDAHGAYAHALKLLAGELESFPEDATRLSRAALYAAKLDQAAQSRGWADAALRRAPDGPDVLFRLAIAAELIGERTVAVQRLKRSFEHGFPQHAAEQEPDLQTLRRDRSYHQLLTENLR